MLWKEIRSWAKSKGYETSKNSESYSWCKASDKTICGEEKSVSKLATAIYNDITNNKWVKYQEEYKNGVS
jgi:hypothetical protein